MKLEWVSALKLELELVEGLVGGIAIDTYGSALRDEEMKLARSEAERTASAQEATARLSAITTLVDHHRSRIDRINSRLRVADATHISGFRSRDATEEEKSELAVLEANVAKYVSDLEQAYERLREEWRAA